MIEVRNTWDWPDPFEVRLVVEGAEPEVARFPTAADAQQYALAKHDTTGEELVYLDDMRFPMNNGNRIAQRLALFTFENAGRVCKKCRVRKPLDDFDADWWQNKTYDRAVFHGWRERCRECEGLAA